MDNNLRLSDIVKYLLLGAFFNSIVVLCLYKLYGLNINDISWVTNLLSESGTLLVSTVALSICYFSGVLIHAFNELAISLYTKLELKEKYIQTTIKYSQNICKSQTLKFLYNKLKHIFSIFFYNTIDQVCLELHRNNENKELYNDWIPNWITLSYMPEKILKILAEKISDNDSKCEYLYLNEFIIGLRFSLIPILIIILFGIKLNLVWLLVLVSFVFIYFLLSRIARIFAIKYIMFVDNCYEADLQKSESNQRREQSKSLLFSRGLPCAYIMVRTTTEVSHHELEECVESIISQDYPNITVIVLEDMGQKPDNTPTETTKRTNFIVEQIKNKSNIEVIYCSDYLNGAAQSSLAIRKIFVNSASKNDVAILLDDDDEFSSYNTVSTIMTKMERTNADLCMIGFKETSLTNHSIINNKNHYDTLLEEINWLNKAVTFDKIQHLEWAATMGWCKCYRYDIVKKYCQLIDECDKIREKRKDAKTFGELKAYEDFPDFMCLLFEGCKITAISKTIYNYKKRNNSITAKLTLKSFDVQRIGFLHYLEEVVTYQQNNFSKEAKTILKVFLRYKLNIIKDILQSKLDNNELFFEQDDNKNYTIDDFTNSYNNKDFLN